MKPKLHTVIAAAIFLAAIPASAAEKPHAQQDKFAQCAHDSKGLKGEERNKFMSECLKGHDAASKPKSHDSAPVKEAHHDPDGRSTQQNRMKSCNEDAGRKDLHGDERRAFMSACLKSRD
jgi:hypothetical protein